jgi:hypothetical protein
VAVVEGECLVLGRLEGRVGRLWGRQGVEVLWAKETTLCRVWQLVEHFGGDVVSQGVVLTGEHLHRVLKLGYLFSQFLNL